MLKFKMKIKARKILPFAVVFLAVFSVSVLIMSTFKKKIEKEQQRRYTEKLKELTTKNSVKLESKEQQRILRLLSPEDTNELLDELNQRVDLYVKKIGLLDKREKELESFKDDLENQKLQLVSMREKYSDTLLSIGKERVALDRDLLVFKGIELKNIKNLAVVYASMDASKSAKALSQLSGETGAKVLASMPAKKSAKIFEEIGPDMAAELTEQMKKLETLKKLSDEALKQKNLKALAGVYQRMEPKKTLAVLKELDDDTSVNILIYMEEKKLAKILESMGAEEASELTDKIRKRSGLNNNIKKRQDNSTNTEGV
ncbi:MAG: hypothetical protein D8M57_02725 [Candidatus Scalindua sp. AMX11]|nr:MAG: hypothetical protein DWQ00_17265 [Candidatus Scalindua sp.]NOG85777.1 hypothetical protein [Planctomycetota bacterium]RZV97047.1 MAG: hypothetical protein EX341_02335 [Candidatus Scalindua sp. SCAELEC01]TDE66339.1 MAG: hypothetical protein D8M57_02725 [Candidatus Scalindua sp. AMX11]GJQ58269.1 MAG: hypothetical protein SCALA701_10700 [Candidatus Scalindua sp.]